MRTIAVAIGKLQSQVKENTSMAHGGKLSQHRARVLNATRQKAQITY